MTSVAFKQQPDEGQDERVGGRGGHHSSPCGAGAVEQRAKAAVLVGRQRRPGHVEEGRGGGAGRIVEEGPHESAQRRLAGILLPHGREIDEARTVVLAGEQAALDHDLEQLANAGRAGRVGQVGADLLHRRAAAAVQDVHDLALAAGQVDRRDIGHAEWLFGPWANFFAHGEDIRGTARRQLALERVGRSRDEPAR